MIIRIDILKNALENVYRAKMDVIFAFILNENGQFDTVWNEKVTGRASGFEYEIMDVTGDGREEIIRKKYIRYQTSINILALLPGQNNMSVIFDEKLFFYLLHPISCRNSYQFVPKRDGGRGYDLMFCSEILRDEDDVFESGSSIFVFNGNEYVAKGVYYDYQARGEAISKDR
jgi:hypothetical protein